jgi:hypothetical protein
MLKLCNDIGVKLKWTQSFYLFGTCSVDASRGAIGLFVLFATAPATTDDPVIPHRLGFFRRYQKKS